MKHINVWKCPNCNTTTLPLIIEYTTPVIYNTKADRDILVVGSQISMPASTRYLKCGTCLITYELCNLPLSIDDYHTGKHTVKYGVSNGAIVELGAHMDESPGKIPEE